MIEGLLIALGGFLGAICRYLVQRLILMRNFPAATIVVNLSGAFLLGLLVGEGIDGRLYLFSAVGFMGAFTTFSTLNVDLLKLQKQKQTKSLIQYAVLTYFGGIGTAIIGLWAGSL